MHLWVVTLSIIARCVRTGQFGIAAMTAVPAVGKLLDHAAARVGAVATQARVNPYLGIDGITLLRQRRCAEDVLAILRRSDPRIESRQLAVIDAAGRTAAFTGQECLPWAGALSGENFSVQGNRLTGRDVLVAAAQALAEREHEPLADRLLEALFAADALGGDRHEEESATICVVDEEDYPLWDIRVDQNDDPLRELRRVHGVFRERLLPEILRMPTRKNPAGDPEEHDA
ncbi:MAG TPA: DUF1028 domain-containing protein [Polyangiales bacterium]|nr:DUF1028 domain-containing protein [Polyangiales bacterium]